MGDSAVDFFLIERLCLYSARAERIYRVWIFHRTWLLNAAAVVPFMIEAQGLLSPEGEPLPHQQAQPLRRPPGSSVA